MDAFSHSRIDAQRYHAGLAYKLESKAPRLGPGGRDVDREPLAVRHRESRFLWLKRPD